MTTSTDISSRFWNLPQKILSGPGALSRSIPHEVLVNIMRDETLRREFLDFCYVYDSQPWCAGMGKDNLVASAEKDEWGHNNEGK